MYAQTDSLQHYYQKSVEAHRSGDYKAFLENAAAANRLRANHPTLTYNLAAAYSLNQQPKKAMKHLQRFVLMNSSLDFAQDTDFAPIMKEKGMSELLQLKQSLSDSISQSQLAFELKTGAIHPECISYSKKTSTYYLGMVHQPGVISYSFKNGQQLFLDRTQLEDLYAVLGIAVDPKKNSLWLVSTVLPQMEGFEEKMNGQSSVYEIDLKTKKVLTSVVIPSDSRLGEILFHQGTVYVADGLKNKVFSLKSGDTQLTLVADLSENARNLQGMAISAKSKDLFVSDYVSGLFKVNLQDGSYQRLQMAGHIPFKGIDGLFFYNNTLLATQNGSRPMRVMQLLLDPKQESVVDQKAIDQNCRYLNEPTQGFLYNNTFFYIANSPWGAYDEEMNFKPERENHIQVRKMKLRP